MIQDPEILALSNVFEAMKDLDNGQRKRIIEWATDKFGISEEKDAAQSSELAVSPEAPLASQLPQSQDSSPGAQPIEPPLPIPPTIKIEAPGQKEPEIKDYKTINELMDAVSLRKNVERVLVCAAFQQIKRKTHELSAREINTVVKNSGTNVSSITASLNALLKKRPPLLELTKQEGKSKRYRVTTEGLDKVKIFLKK